MNKIHDTPVYIHRGKNHLRYLAIIILISITLLSLHFIQIIGYSMLPVTISSLIGLLTIRFPFIYLFNDHFIIFKKGVIKKYNQEEIYNYDEIREIEFKGGYIKWGQMIVQTIFGKGAYGGFSKPDRMILKLRDDKLKIIYRFGTKKDFEDLTKRIHKSIKPSK